MRHERFDPFIDFRSLSAGRRAALKQGFVRRAHAARALAMRQAIVRASGVYREPAAVAVRAIRDALAAVWTAALRRRERQQALTELRAMRDYELRDMGISRSQISAAVGRGERDAASPDRRL